MSSLPSSRPRDLGLPIAVRGGGHSVAGHAMADGALVVDLRDDARGHGRPGDAGSSGPRAARSGTTSTRPPGSTTWRSSAARSATPGVGGLTLGGGIGWLSGVAGFTCDNLIRAEVVTAAGEKVVAGPDGDPDLLWALRGGGGNFGVVTSFEFRAIDPGPILAGYIRYPVSRGQAGPAPARRARGDRPGRARADGRHRAARPADRRRLDGPRRRGLARRRAAEPRGPPPPCGRRLPVIDDERRADGVPGPPGDERSSAVRASPLLEGPLPARTLDEPVIGGVVESMAAAARRHQLHPASRRSAARPHRARGRRRIRPAGRDLERERARRLGGPGRPMPAQIAWARDDGRPASARLAAPAPATPTTPRSTRPSNASGSPSATSASPGWPRSRRATTRRTGSGST